jgi:hypothetical protein
MSKARINSTYRSTGHVRQSSVNMYKKPQNILRKDMGRQSTEVLYVTVINIMMS